MVIMVDLLVEFAPWRVHIYILPCCSTAAATVLNSAGDGAQFARSRCSISGGILKGLRLFLQKVVSQIHTLHSWTGSRRQSQSRMRKKPSLTKSGNRNVIYEYKSEVEARMVILSGCRRETEIQRGLPPLRPAMQAEFPGRHGGVSVIPLEEDRRGQKNVGIKVEKTAIYPL